MVEHLFYRYLDIYEHAFERCGVEDDVMMVAMREFLELYETELRKLTTLELLSLLKVMV